MKTEHFYERIKSLITNGLSKKEESTFLNKNLISFSHKNLYIYQIFINHSRILCLKKIILFICAILTMLNIYIIFSIILDDECKICMENSIKAVFLECGHIAACLQYAQVSRFNSIQLLTKKVNKCKNLNG